MESCGNVFDHFSEVNEVCSLIDNLPNVLRNMRELEFSQQRLTVIVDKYQEQPHLLDPHLELIIGKLFSLARLEDAPPKLMHHAFKYIYLFTKTRGAKVIIRWFSHEVSDLECVVDLIQKQDVNDFSTWETRYVLLLWLSIIIIIPFDLSRLDVSSTHSLTVDRLSDIGKLYLNVTDKSQDAAVLLCSKFLSRPDVQKSKLTEFIEWSRSIILTDAATANSTAAAHSNLQCGILKTFASLFKISKREDMLTHAPIVLELINQSGFIDSNTMLLRKLYIKLTQRLGTIFLPVRLLSWRYQRGSRSLEATLKGGVVEDVGQDVTQEDEDFDVPEEIEEILGTLLVGLKDKDTVVRWSSAKGIGRITGRLPLHFANEVLDSLLDCFGLHESDGAWHGGCLALAELGRRGLLLPQRLADVVPVVLKALIYDEKRGSCSVGSHVRDAACYVCWSFARAYEPEQLKPFIDIIAKGLVTVMIFDREVNCRRAASAAFQENVGRQGTLPYGIEILTMADYFAVGNISHVYLTLSVQVGHYLEYTRTLIDHVVELKLLHWDCSLRELAAQSLHNMASLDPQYMKDHVLPLVVSQITCNDLCLRHGSLYAAAELFYALSKIAKEQFNQSIELYLGDVLIQSFVGAAGKLVSGNLFKGISGEIMRPAALKFIEKCSETLPLTDDVLDLWQSIIDDNLSYTVDSIRDAAVVSFKAVCIHKYSASPAGIGKVQNVLLPSYESNLKHKNQYTRMGFALALGSLPKVLLEGKLDEILSCLLISASTIHDVSTVYAESRRDAIIAIKKYFNVRGAINNFTSICETVDVNGPPSHALCEELIDKIFSSLFIAMGDYTIDSRGDIGTIVREASMNALESLCLKLSNHPSLIKAQHMESALGHFIQQSNEKIDRTRALACNKLISLIHHQPPLYGITDHDKLLEIFKSDLITDVNWCVARKSFPFTVQTLGLLPYSYRTFLGLITSVGGLTESIVQSSTSNLLIYLKKMTNCEDMLSHFTEQILTILDNYSKDSRVIVPLFKTLEVLLYDGIFDLYLYIDSMFPNLLLEKLKVEVKGCRDPLKLLASITVFCGLVQFKNIKKSCLNQIMIYLGHTFPKVRRTTADQLYTTIITFDDLFAVEVTEQLMNILSDTAWDGHISSVREQRNVICTLLELPLLKAKEGTKSKTRSSKKDDMSYRDLVDRMGY